MFAPSTRPAILPKTLPKGGIGSGSGNNESGMLQVVIAACLVLVQLHGDWRLL